MKLFKKISIMLSSLLIMASLGSAFAPKYNSHADETNTWNITKRIASKQFSARCYDPSQHPMKHHKYEINDDDGVSVSTSKMNKAASNKMDNYLIRVRNLGKYHLYFSRISDTNTRNVDIDDVTVTVTFIRK